MSAQAYQTIPDDEFYERLDNKLNQLTHDQLVDLIREYAHEQVSELFNNEIIREWESEFPRCEECGNLNDTPNQSMCRSCTSVMAEQFP